MTEGNVDKEVAHSPNDRENSEVAAELPEHNHLFPKKSPQFTVSQVLINRGIPLDILKSKVIKDSFILKPSNEAFLTYMQVISTPEFQAINRSLSYYEEPNFDNCDFSDDIKKRLRALYFEMKAKDVEDSIKRHKPRPELGDEYYWNVDADKVHAKELRKKAKETRGKLRPIKEKEIRSLLEGIVNEVLT